MKKTLYEILEVAPDANPDAIRESYRRTLAREEAARKPGDEDAENRLKFIKHAYGVLSDPNQRAAYDASLKMRSPDSRGEFVDPFPASEVNWRRWIIGGTAAIVVLVAGFTALGFLQLKSAPKPRVAQTAPGVIVVSPQASQPRAQPQARSEATSAVSEAPGAAPGSRVLSQEVRLGEAVPSQRAAPALTAEGIFEKRSRSITVVLGFDGSDQQILQGSGVVIEPERVITNCHVVRNAEILKVRYASRIYPARLEYGDQDPTRDLCKLMVPQLEAPPVALGDSRTLKVGKRVFALGAPLGLELSLSEGIVSGLRSHQDAAYIQITTPISPGSSGGALFDEAGELVGLTTFGAIIGQNVNFAVPVEWVKDLPNRPRTAYLPRTN